MMATCAVCYPRDCPECEGERRKLDALALLSAHREAVIRRAQRALLTVLLETGSATVDDVRELVELPPGVGPKCFGAAPVRSPVRRSFAPMASPRLADPWVMLDP